MAENNNALAELAERLRLILDLQMPGTPYYQDRMIFCTPEVVDKSMRIVAELAKASDAIGYADEFAKDGFKDCIYIPATQQLCVKKILKCCAIAAEGVTNG